MAGLSTTDAVLAAFDDHLRRVRGVSPETRRGYVRVARRLLDAVFGDGQVDLARLSASDVVGFVFEVQGRYRPSTLQGVTTALRSFLRFLAVEGVCVDRLEEAVPKVALRRLASVPRHLSSSEFECLIASLYERDSPDGLRARAMLLLAARLGLRAGEIARLGLEDIDWRSGTVRIRTRKTGHGALLPLPVDVGEAIVGYLQRGRPASDDRHVFLLHQQRVGAPIDRRVVGDVTRRAVARAGIQAPVRGANLLRHSLASGLLASGASLKEIADLFGHRALSSTQVYAKVNVLALREAALPWPEVTRRVPALSRAVDNAGHNGPVELASLLAAADRLSPHGGLRPACYVTLFGLLACTGLRISEALALTRGDVNLAEGIMTIRNGKGGRARLVPLHRSALEPLGVYRTHRDRVAGGSPDGAFFRTDSHERLTYAAVRGTFKRLRHQLGWTSDGRARRPRIHDLRHRMIVQRVIAWYAEGADVDARLPALATYVGHAEISALYWYFSVTPELMSVVSDRFGTFGVGFSGGAR